MHETQSVARDSVFHIQVPDVGKEPLPGETALKGWRVCVCSSPPARFSEENGKQLRKACQLEDWWKTAISLQVVGSNGLHCN